MSLVKIKDLSETPLEELKSAHADIEMRLEGSHIREKTRSIIDQYDIDEDGRLDRHELRRFFEEVFAEGVFNVDVTRGFVNKVLDEYDHDSNEKLDHEELVDFGKKILNAFKEEVDRCIAEKS